MTGRHEFKHYINYADILQLRSRLPLIMEMDEHSTSKAGYVVRSLYFDNYADKALFEKINGVDNREKFRLRLYNGNFSLILLEKKSVKRTLLQEQCSNFSRGMRGRDQRRLFIPESA